MGTERYTQARIRVNEDGAIEVQAALELYERHLLEVRRTMMEEGSSEAIASLNRRLGSVRRVLEETVRTIEQQGWT